MRSLQHMAMQRLKLLQPSVAVIATGSELLDVNDVLEDGKFVTLMVQ